MQNVYNAQVKPNKRRYCYNEYKEVISSLQESKELLNAEPIQMIKTIDDSYIEIVLQWTTAYTETSLCFTNNIFLLLGLIT